MRLACSVFVLTFMTACGGPLSLAPPVERTPVSRAATRIARVARADVSGVLVYTGDLRPKPGVTVSARTTGRIDRLLVEPGSIVREGDTLAELDRSALEVQVVQGQAALAAAEARLAGLEASEEPHAREEAEARLRAARARLASLESGPRAETIPQLVQTLREARRRLEELDGDRATAIAQAESRLLAARGRLDQALTRPLQAIASPTPIDPIVISQARGDIQLAEEDLARARRPVTTEELAAARQDVARAEDELLLARNPVGPSDLEEARATVEAAEIRLRQAGEPASPATIKAAQTAVDYAWATLELARLQLREATIVAPINAVVTETHQRPGVGIAAGAPIVSLQPPDFEMILSVGDRDVGQIKVGQGVSLSVDAYPGEAFSGTIRSIAPSVDVRTRTVAAKVDVLDPQVKLKSGLFAQAAIPGPRRQGVLVIPRDALLPGAETAVMQVVDGRARRQLVQLGATDGRNVEIVQGLPEGAEVVAPPLGVAEGDLIPDR
jgi:multidrug efflux pump subunit AcrA (membrane-fusion protein)